MGAPTDHATLISRDPFQELWEVGVINGHTVSIALNGTNATALAMGHKPDEIWADRATAITIDPALVTATNVVFANATGGALVARFRIRVTHSAQHDHVVANPEVLHYWGAP